MKIKKVLITVLFVIGLGFGFGGHVEAKQELLDRVVAVVNDDIITQSELDGLLRPLYEQYMRDYSGQTVMKMLAEAQDKLLSQLIEDRLVYQEALNKKLDISETEIEREMIAFRQRFGSEAKLEEALRSENISIKDLQDKLKKQALVRKLHEIEVRSKVVVSPREVEEYFAAHQSEFAAPEQIRITSLTIKKSDESRAKGITDEDAQGRLRALQERAKKGEDFNKLIEESSEDKHADQGGKGNWILRGQMIPAVDEIIFATPEGQMTDVIETPIGYHLFKVVEKQLPVQKTFEQSRDQIYDILFQKKSEERFTRWIEDLRKSAYISVKGKKI
ncbi:MAG TPA: peptidylprolyl isomerase [Candidatus Omnitrophota bacterium]|nr:peptidylprolyl isomerase [Candidatus Omnitrophota bacterium]